MGHAAAQTVVANAGGNNKYIKLVWGALDVIFAKFGGRTAIWPPSRKSAPWLAGLWIAISLLLYRLCLERKSNAIVEVQEIRRKYALSSLENLIANEDARLKKEAEKNAAKEEAEKKKKKEKAVDKDAAEENEKRAKETPGKQPHGGAKNEDMDDGTEDDEEEPPKDDEDEKVPPDPVKLFDLLFDEIEHSPITSIGYVSAVCVTLTAWQLYDCVAVLALCYRRTD